MMMLKTSFFEQKTLTKRLDSSENRDCAHAATTVEAPVVGYGL